MKQLEIEGLRLKVKEQAEEIERLRGNFNTETLKQIVTVLQLEVESKSKQLTESLAREEKARTILNNLSQFSSSEDIVSIKTCYITEARNYLSLPQDSTALKEHDVRLIDTLTTELEYIHGSVSDAISYLEYKKDKIGKGEV